MNLAEKHLDDLTALFGSIETEFDMLKGELSQLDSKISDVLHFIEEGGFNAYQGYLMAKTIQDLRQKRRKVKSNLDDYRVIMSKLIFKEKSTLKTLKESISRKSKKYHPRYLTRDEVLKK